MKIEFQEGTIFNLHHIDNCHVTNHIEFMIKGDRKGQYSISINAQWRICFRFEGNDVFDVEIIDYH